MAKALIFHLIFSLAILTISNQSYSSTKVTKIVAIHSYSDDFPWTKMLRDSYIEELKLKKVNFVINNIYFDVKKNPVAFGSTHPLLTSIEKTLKESKPELIFISDDFALQQMAQLLVDLKVPFVFSGINGNIPDLITKSNFKKYTGIYERYYVYDSVKLLKRILRKNKLRLLILLEQSETSDAVATFAKKELARFKDVQFDTIISNKFDDWKSAIESNQKKYDALLPLQPYSLQSSDGIYVKPTDVISWISKNSQTPTIFTAGWHIKCGGTLAIAHRPKAQGQLAADFSADLLKDKINKPITPSQGDIVINYAVTEKLKLSIPFDLLTTASIERKVEEPCDPK